jgi:hypothetical protein
MAPGKKVAEGLLKASGLHGLARGRPAKLVERSAWPEEHWWQAIARRRGSPAVMVRGQIRRAQGRRPRTGARGRPWAWGGAPAVVLGGEGAAERPAHGGAEARCSGAERGSGARVWGSCGVGDEAPKGHGVV